MFVPAAIIQGLYFGSKRPVYLNYGAVGTIIGHEITHGFDKSGSNYDEKGIYIYIYIIIS